MLTSVAATSTAIENSSVPVSTTKVGDTSRLLIDDSKIEIKIVKTDSSNDIMAEISHLSANENVLVVWDCNGVLAKENGDKQIFDNQIPVIVSELQKKNIKTVVLTATGTPEQLKTLGYHFEKSWTKTKTKEIFINTDKTTDKVSCLYRDGVILGNLNISKRPCLEAFLKYAKIKPSKIIFVDDRKKNIYDIEELCKSEGIKYVGFIYLGDPTIAK